MIPNKIGAAHEKFGPHEEHNTTSQQNTRRFIEFRTVWNVRPKSKPPQKKPSNKFRKLINYPFESIENSFFTKSDRSILSLFSHPR